MAANEITRVYAKSLVDVGQEKGILDQLNEEIKYISQLIDEDEELGHFLISPSISRSSKTEFIRKVFSNHLSEYTINLLNVLIENDRQSYISDIAQNMGVLIDEINNRQTVTLISALEIDNKLKDKLKTGLSDMLKQDIRFRDEIDPDILGGIVIKIGDKVIDGSLLKDLNNIKKSLLNSKVRRDLAYED